MPAFSETGFKVGKLPKEVCDYVIKFVQDNHDHVRKEGFPRDGTQINAREVPTFMMHFLFELHIQILFHLHINILFHPLI